MNTLAQHFLDCADSQIPAPRKARQRAADKRAEQARDKALHERDQLLRWWKRWRRERRDALLVGPHGEAAQALIAFLAAMTLEQAPALIALVERGPWRQADADTRFEVLALFDGAIVQLRERHGLPPFDDALPWSGARPTAFQIIRELLR